jgi:putative ABC transport system ATP-binding protein
VAIAAVQLARGALGAGASILMSDVFFAWRDKTGFALRIERLEVACGEKILLIGPSGSGKSTLLSLLCGIVVPRAGVIQVLGTDMAQLSGAARDRFRAAHFGIIFQMFNLLPYLSILDNVLLPLRFAPERRARAAAVAGTEEREGRRLLAGLGLDVEALSDGSTAELSVGQQQRVAAARALIGGPEIILADEPTSALDRARQHGHRRSLLPAALACA